MLWRHHQNIDLPFDYILNKDYDYTDRCSKKLTNRAKINIFPLVWWGACSPERQAPVINNASMLSFSSFFTRKARSAPGSSAGMPAAPTRLVPLPVFMGRRRVQAGCGLGGGGRL